MRGQRGARRRFQSGTESGRADEGFYSQIQSRVFAGRRLGREQSMSDHQGFKPGDSKRQQERKSPAKSEYTAEREALLRQMQGYLQASRPAPAPGHSPEPSEPQSETPYEGTVEDPPGCRAPTGPQIQCRGWGLWRVAGPRWPSDPPVGRLSPTHEPVLNAIQQFLS